MKPNEIPAIIAEAKTAGCKDADEINGYLAAEVSKLRTRLADLLSAVTSKRAEDTSSPIMWSGSAAQNRAMYAAIDAARKVIQ